jgi:serine/threonine protein phosphatase PrpC
MLCFFLIACSTCKQETKVDDQTLIMKVAKLLPYAKKAKALPGLATAYDYEPDGPEFDQLGRLLVVVEVLSAPKQAEAVVDLIIRTLGETYYAKAGQHDSPAYDNFAAAVKAVNKQLVDYAERGHAGWVGRLSAILALHTAKELHLTQAGSAAAYLYRGGAASQITSDLTGLGSQRPANTFASIATGRLQSHDRLLLATPALYHQSDKLTLHQVITESSPAVAVEKLSELVNQNHDADRVAAIIAELGTPTELADQRGAAPVDAVQVKVGRPDSILDTAKQTAAPVVTQGLKGAKILGETALHQTKSKIVPGARTAALAATGWLRRNLRTKRQRNIAGAIVLACLIFGGGLLYQQAGARAIEQHATRYDSAYTAVQTARGQISSGDKQGAKQNLLRADKELDSLANLPQAALVNRRLAKRSHPEDDPASIQQLQAAIKTLLDQIEGLTTVAPEELLDLSQLKGTTPSFIETINDTLVMISRDGSIFVYDAKAGQVKHSIAKTNGIGKVISTTASSTNDGVYILSDEPGVWHFKLDGNSLTRQTSGQSGWPKAKAISSYNGNLYLLAEDNSQIYRHSRTIAGFSGRSAYLTASPSTLQQSTGMAIDGSVYTAGTYGIKRFITGKFDRAIILPEALSNPSALVSFADGDRLLVLDLKSHRLGIIATDANNLSFLLQLALKGNPKVQDSKVSSKQPHIFILTEDKLLRTPLPD